MSPLIVLGLITGYFSVLLLIAHLTGRGADNRAFFLSNRQAPWYLVAYAMIGTTISGITYISVPGWVGTNQFSYLQMVLGYLPGYLVIATVLMPLYYRLNLTSIYGYLEQRFGAWSYRTGAFFFLLSRIIGSAFRLYLVAAVLHLAVFGPWGIPYWVTVAVTVGLIWIYTAGGGTKTIIRTDIFQTTFMLAAVVLTITLIARELGFNGSSLATAISNSNYSRIFFFDDWNDNRHFVKQFISGAFIAVVMTGLDQDMMQKNLSCKNIGDAQKNMFWFCITLVLVNVLFLCLGALLYMYADARSISLPVRSDDLYPMLATRGYLGPAVAMAFILGLIAAAYSSADSALTALTTSLSVDFLGVEKMEREGKALRAIKMRKTAHLIMSVMLLGVILIFRAVNDRSVIDALFTVAGYTYGPLLGIFAFGLMSRRKLYDRAVPFIALASPMLCYILNKNSALWFGGYRFGYELLVVNGMITYLGLLAVSSKLKTGNSFVNFPINY